MLIAIDIGNSSINIGFFVNRDLFTFKIDTYPVKAAEEYSGIFEGFLSEKGIEKPVDRVIISSVVPAHTGIILNAARSLSSREPLMVGPELDTGLSFDIKRPWEIGADRIANAVAAYSLFGARVLVVDFGTATTITAVGDNGRYIGGAILPGIGLMKEALFRGTAKLPDVTLAAPKSALGKDTGGCILSGLIYGTAGAIDRIISEIEREEGCSFKVVATGGYFSIAAPFTKRVDSIEPNLTIQGLRLIYERNA